MSFVSHTADVNHVASSVRKCHVPSIIRPSKVCHLHGLCLFVCLFVIKELFIT